MLLLITHILFYSGKEVLENRTVLRYFPPAPPNDGSEPALGEESQGLKVPSTNTPDLTLQWQEFVRILQHHQLIHNSPSVGQ